MKDLFSRVLHDQSNGICKWKTQGRPTCQVSIVLPFWIICTCVHMKIKAVVYSQTKLGILVSNNYLGELGRVLHGFVDVGEDYMTRIAEDIKARDPWNLVKVEDWNPVVRFNTTEGCSPSYCGENEN